MVKGEWQVIKYYFGWEGHRACTLKAASAVSRSISSAPSSATVRIVQT